MTKSEKLNVFLCLFCVFVCLVFCIARIDNVLGWDGDNIQIFHQMLAFINNSVEEFLPKYAFLCDMTDDAIAMKAYSWGTSMIISPLYFIAGFKNIILYKSVMVLFYLLLVAFIYYFFQRKVNSLFAFFSALIFASSMYMIELSNDILKDLPFTACVIASAYFFNNLISDTNDKKRIFSSVLFTIFLFFSMMFRENGCIIFAIFTASSLIKLLTEKFKDDNFKTRNVILYLSPYIAVAIIYAIVCLKYPVIDSRNWSAFSFNIDSMCHMFLYYMKNIYIDLFCFSNRIINYFYAILLSALFIIGFLKNFKKEYLSAIFVLSFIFFVIFSYEQGLRYILYILPFVFLFICLGITSINNKKIRITATTLFIVFACMNFYRSYMEYIHIDNFLYKWNDEGCLSSDSKQLYNYIKENTPKDSVIINSYPRMILLFTERNSFAVTENWENYKNGDYQVSIIGDYTPGYEYQMFDFNERTFVEKCGVYLNPIFRNENYVLYKIEKE